MSNDKRRIARDGQDSSNITLRVIAERPCYYRGMGRIKGSYVRAGDSDEPMTEYEIYSYEAFRRK